MYGHSLTRDQEKELAPRARRFVLRKGKRRGKGRRCDREAATRMVQSVTGLVGQLAKHFQTKTGLPHEDLFQEGMVAVTRCLAVFRPELGYKFTTYAGDSAYRQMDVYCARMGRQAFAYANSFTEACQEGDLGPNIKGLLALDEPPADDPMDAEALLRHVRNPLTREIIRLRFGLGREPMKAVDVAPLVGKTRTNVGMLVKTGLQQIRRALAKGSVA
jgi:RNA polymerase sigma factor (sigma-70 family)